MRHIAAIAAALALAGNAQAHPESSHGENAAPIQSIAPAARSAAAVVEAFHLSLQRGDTKSALSYLAENALIYESGSIERSRKEYALNHLGADAAFAQAVPGTVTRRAGDAFGNMAWIATEGRTIGNYKGKDVDRVTNETMILGRIGNAWKIVHIHWSSGAGAK